MAPVSQHEDGWSLANAYHRNISMEPQAHLALKLLDLTLYKLPIDIALANIFQRYNEGENLLHVVALLGYTHKASVAGSSGKERYITSSKYLMELGFDPFQEDHTQRSAVDVAAAKGKSDILALIQKKTDGETARDQNDAYHSLVTILLESRLAHQRPPESNVNHWRPARVSDAAKCVLALLGISYQSEAGGAFVVSLAPAVPPLHSSVVTWQLVVGTGAAGRSLGLDAGSLCPAFVGQILQVEASSPPDDPSEADAYQLAGCNLEAGGRMGQRRSSS
ncbi:hypothetical protein GB937_009779 [Aspergillus fischeri]|nr:hypothetical protein GB937_009779 [Aspergillus fischeri]